MMSLTPPRSPAGGSETGGMFGAGAGSVTRDVVEAASKFWWLFLMQGIVALIMGVLLIVVPGRTLLFIALMFGIYLVFWGVVHLFAAFLVHEGRGLHAILGVLGMVAGLVVAGHTLRTTLFVTLVFGIFLIVWGAYAIFGPLEGGATRALRVIEGVIAVVAGLVVIVVPGPSLLFLALVLGFYLIFFGILDIGIALRLRSAGGG